MNAKLAFTAISEIPLQALVALAEVDAGKPDDVRACQLDIRCFDRILVWLKEIVTDGIEAGDELDADSRADIAETLGLTDDEADDVHDGLPTNED
jgi:hypothetical protein